jgi:glycerophosphoryl diester phosphodiesterase
MPERRIAVHGHRGARAAFPENTLPAFACAIAAGADYIELDVQATCDGVLVVCHDPVLKRRRCQGPPGSRTVGRLTLAELRQFDCGSLRNRRFPHQAAVPGTRIPTLEEVFALAPQGDFRFNIEVKTFPQKDRRGPQSELRAETYAGLLLDAVGRSGLGARVEVQSFDLRVLEAIGRRDATVPLAALCQFWGRGTLRLARQAGATTVGPYQRLVTRGGVARAHAAGLRVVPWTANRPRDWARLIRAGVDGIITDDPAGLVLYLRERGLREAPPRSVLTFTAPGVDNRATKSHSTVKE